MRKLSEADVRVVEMATSALWGSLITMVALAVPLYLLGEQSSRYRTNAMDLCAWHARSIFNDDPNGTQQRWRDVAKGELACPFCGQLHNKQWVSRNGWDSQVNAFILEDLNHAEPSTIPQGTNDNQ